MPRFLISMGEFIKNNSTYIAVFAGFLLGLPAVRFAQAKEKRRPFGYDAVLCLAFSGISVLSVLLFASLEGLLGGKGFSFGAVSTYGAYLLAPVFLLLLFRKNRAEIFDSFAVYAPVSLLLQRIRCIISGCCYGRMIGGSAYRWPVREAEILFYAVFLVVCIWMLREEGSAPARGKKGGRRAFGSLFPLLMIYYGTLRFFLQFARGDAGAGLFHIAHLWSVVCAAAGLSIYTELSKKRENKKDR